MKKINKLCFCALAGALSLLILLSLFSVPADAAGTRSGVVNDTFVNVRTGPSTGYESIGIQLNTGDPVTVISEHPDASGGSTPWYFIEFYLGSALMDGYIRSDFVTIGAAPPVTPPPVVPNTDFEVQLAAFPESYKPAIRALHNQHPNWNFEAFYPNVFWTTILDLENRLGYSYINDGIISHYSTAPGAYDWATDTYFVREGTNWYQAHPDMVAYFLDPRNFLNETDIFQFERLAFSPSVQTEANIAMMLQGTFMEGKSTVNLDGVSVSYARAFLDAANATGVSAFHLVTRCIQEVGWYGSACVHGAYGGELSGYFNFFNIGAYGGAYNGMVYAKNAGWDTAYKAIYYGGSFIGNEYIARGQNTPYYQKFNVVEPNAIGSHQYMTNIAAARSEGRIQRNEYSALGFLDTAFTFSIPIYWYMPDIPCAAPAPAGSPNNYLKSLSVDGYAITPYFDVYDCINTGRLRYDLEIKGNVSSVNITATAVSSTAWVGGDIGNVSLSYGDNYFFINCTAANNSLRQYILGIRVIPPPQEVGPFESDVVGDLNGDSTLNSDDAIFLLFHTMFPDRYFVCQDTDFDESGISDPDDSIYLLFHVMFPDRYPIKKE